VRSVFIQHQNIERVEGTVIIFAQFCARVDLFNENGFNRKQISLQ